jgi:hypothetical protein
MENTAVGIGHAYHVAPSIRKSGGRSVGIVRPRTQTMEFLYTVGMIFWEGDQPVARQLPLHRTT